MSPFGQSSSSSLSIRYSSHLLRNLKDGIYAKWIHGATGSTCARIHTSPPSISLLPHYPLLEKQTTRSGVVTATATNPWDGGGGLEGSAAEAAAATLACGGHWSRNGREREEQRYAAK